MLNQWKTLPFWQHLFHICFNDDFLVFLFGKEAIQHGEKNSYIEYFRQRFEWGLFQEDSYCNYFLHSILLGRYQQPFAPDFLTSGQHYSLNYHTASLLELDSIAHYDLISLSNILDWCDQDTISQHTKKLQSMKPGSVLILRQLNNQQSLRPLLEPAFSFDQTLSEQYQAKDRSLFYNTIEIATRTTAGTLP
ncbi:MAG: hypothetical protein B0D91_13565 [Oceanospirillales bacterium LUC14_002_19_P2]|nr:MAG: hypothetical protein B0D91_13565 [Oceanospirillales bacterium LUC14_002_19_P2]